MSPQENFAVLEGSLARQPDPQPREHRRQRDDENRVERLEIAGAEKPPERKIPRVQVRVAFGEQVQGGTRLLERGPEQRRAR